MRIMSMLFNRYYLFQVRFAGYFSPTLFPTETE